MGQQATTDHPRGGRTPLTRERVVRAGVELADEAGIESVTMRRLAQRLGVEAMSLYHHVANKEDLLDGMVDLVFGEIELPGLGTDWRIAMRRRAVSARTALARHRWAIALMDSRASPGPATLRHHDRVLGNLRAAGFPIAMAAHAVAVLDSYVYGFALQEASLPVSSSDELAAAVGTTLQRLSEADYPRLTEMMEHALRVGYAFAHEFEWGLELVLDGLARALDSPPRGGAATHRTTGHGAT
jgi:AcrR family transcriptional regulator